jgi:hypothetical protein
MRARMKPAQCIYSGITSRTVLTLLSHTTSAMQDYARRPAYRRQMLGVVVRSKLKATVSQRAQVKAQRREAETESLAH